MSAQSKKILFPHLAGPEHVPVPVSPNPHLNRKLHYVNEDHGPTLLLLHGNGSWSFGIRLIISALSSHFRVIALDYPSSASTPPT